MGNLITVGAGFLLASKGVIDIGLFFATLIGLAFIMASGCVFYYFFDRQIDKKMDRTKERALVTGLISGRNAIVFAIALCIVGNLVLLSYTNFLTTLVAGFGFFVYVFLYSLWKSRTIYGTAIGSVAGAIPPVVGYCAVSNHFDTGALILFSMMVLWQMPHFFSIAVYHLKDYSAAGLPVLPLKKGMLRTKVHMVIYIAAFILTSMMLTLFQYTGTAYLVVATLIGLAWLGLCLKGFNSENDQVWGYKMFRLSLVLIIAICIAIPLDIV